MADSRVLHCVESVAAAKEILRANHCSVGLVVFDSPEPAFREEIEQLISATPTTEWIAIVTRTTIGYKALHAFILNAFHDFHTLPVDPQRLAMTIGHACGRAGLRLALAAPDNASGRFGILGASPAMTDFFRKLEKVVDADLPVLIGGESGTGKELVAKAMHGHSSRSQRPFVVVNCAAIPANLIQAELFGYEKGAFTGATERKIGKIEAANGGLLFLDEIGDLPLELQGNLLRVLQERTIMRLGSTQAIPVDFRLVAATHVDLHEAMVAKRFREDLFYRLNVIQLHLPPLRERGGDIAMLAETVLRNFASATPKCRVAGFTAEALRTVNSYPWPGNVRELINRVRRGVIMSEGRLVGSADMGFEAADLEPAAVTLEAARASFERDIVETSLRANSNNVSKTARQLGISRVTLYRVMNRLQIAL
ncbi:MAG: sigma-54-dependent Fis family transcriptional regulator [Dechloromonas sp.]|nr:sigma-54-dependent Fis family transcriptional regulator [Dechloromonas sp.]